MTYLSGLDAEPLAKSTLKRVLENAARESLRHAYMTKLRTRLDSESAKRFEKLYDKRSGSVHDGKGRGDLQASASEAREIAVRLLEADLLAEAVRWFLRQRAIGAVSNVFGDAIERCE